MTWSTGGGDVVEDEDVHSSVLVVHRVGERADGAVVAHVGGDRGGVVSVRAQGRGVGLCPGAVEICQHNPAAAVGQLAGDRHADAARVGGAGHDGDLAGEVLHVGPFLSGCGWDGSS